ncbi:MAG TPA: branched-chain amino acid ABC transporter permease [Rhizobiaceae bacterium]|nr:branched-chain amino acid ABC transporter permease [Rhizobiaceae bacterium]
MTATLIYAAIINGILSGGLYALLGLAIVLIFRTTTIANFAQGEMGMLSAFLLIMYATALPLPLWGQWLATVLISGAVGALIYWLILRPNPQAEHLNMTIRTLALYSLIFAVVSYRWGGNEPYTVPSLFPAHTVDIGGIFVSVEQVGSLSVMAILGVAFLLFFRFTETGLTMRAVAINPDIAGLLGINVGRVSLLVWVIAGFLGGVVGLLVAPQSFLDTTLMRPYILKAFTAAVLGGLYSFPGVILGGLLLGLAESFASIWISPHLREPFAFLVLLLILLVRPEGILGTRHRVRV